MDINEFLSDNARNMKPSPIRALLNVVNQPGIISFAGGFPNPLSFPVEEIKQIMNEVLDEEGVKALQYGGTDGNAKLREEISKRYIKQGLDIDKDNIIITTAVTIMIITYQQLFRASCVSRPMLRNLILLTTSCNTKLLLTLLKMGN